jgi:uncharacterized protein YxjI
VTEQSSLTLSRAAALDKFRGYDRLSVRQKKKWLEILLSFELKNRYQVFDQSQQAVLEVAEVGSGIWPLLGRLFLGPFRAFTAEVTDLSVGRVALRLHRRFRFIFHRLEVKAATGESLGAIEMRWSWLRRIYDIQDATGRVVAQLYGPFLKPWTFEVRVGDRVVGQIQKRWSGLGKELFTDADNFGVDLAGLEDPALKVLVFAATVLVDVVHFEAAK